VSNDQKYVQLDFLHLLKDSGKTNLTLYGTGERTILSHD
jgi:hypothetical protein